MVKSNFKIAFCSFMVGIFFAISATVVLAATADGPYLLYSEYGYNYQARNSVDASGAPFAITKAESRSGTVPTGYISVKAQLFRDDKLDEYTDWTYNPVPCVGYSKSTQKTFLGGNYYSKGFTSAYNGNGYTIKTPGRSPSISY